MSETVDKLPIKEGEEWRDAAGYDLCLDSAALGEDGCVDRIIKLLPGFIE